MAVIDFCTIADVKTHVKHPDGDDDAQLTEIVQAMSLRFEQELGMPSEAAARTEVRRLKYQARNLSLYAAPATVLTSIKLSVTHDFSAVTALTSNTDYVVDLTTAVVQFLFPITYTPGWAEIVYTAGLGTNTAAIQTAFPDLQQACVQQCAYEWQRKNTMGGNQTVSGASTEYTGQYRLLENVVNTLVRHRRRHL